MELGLCLDDDFFTEKTLKDKPKQKPYNVKLCEREWMFNSLVCSDKVDKQNITKFKADVWYRNGKYFEALRSYKFIQENPQVSSNTVEREINESVARCHIKLKQFAEAVHVVHKMFKDYGEDTSLMLMLAQICSATDNIQGEIACLKRCISLHSYNHHFWYLLALAYSKACDYNKSSDFTGASQNRRVPRICTEPPAIADGVAELLNRYKSINHKDSLKVFIKCFHCKCLGEKDLEEKHCQQILEHSLPEKVKNEQEQSTDSESENTCAIDEIVIFMEIELSMNCENRIETNTGNNSQSSNLSTCEGGAKDIPSSQSIFDKSHGCVEDHSNKDSNTKTREQGSCSFSVKLKSSKYDQHQIRLISPMDQKLFSFFCLIRARFHLQRAIWTASSFIKEKLASELAQVSDRIDKCALCKCGELKKCCIQRIETEDATQYISE